jgi:hypothetical protein
MACLRSSRLKADQVAGLATRSFCESRISQEVSMGMMKRTYHDNIVQLFSPKAVREGGWPWMSWHREWWDTKGGKLDWQPISTYQILDPSMALATPYLLRAGDRVTVRHGPRRSVLAVV